MRKGNAVAERGGDFTGKVVGVLVAIVTLCGAGAGFAGYIKNDIKTTFVENRKYIDANTEAIRKKDISDEYNRAKMEQVFQMVSDMNKRQEDMARDLGWIKQRFYRLGTTIHE